MSVFRRTLIAAPTALGLLATFASAAAALPPARTLFTWTGRVDREVILVVRGRHVETRASGLDASFAPRLEVRDDLPRQVGALEVHKANGRGDVEMLQQPSARNDYTAMLRVWDSRSGSDDYRVVVTWQPTGDVRNDRGGNDRGGNDRGGNDDWDRDRNPGRGNDRDRDDYGNNGRGNGRGNGGRDRDNDGWNNRGNRDAGGIVWTGDVDDVVDIRIRGRRVEYRTRSGAPLRDVRYDFRGNPLPNRAVTLDLGVSRGRGNVEVIQHPNRSNKFTAIIRVTDRRDRKSVV